MARALVAVATILLTAMIALQIPEVQTFVVRKSMARIQNRFDGEIEFGSIAIQPFNTLIVTDLSIIDNDPWPNGPNPPSDTLFRAGSLMARFNPAGLLSKNGIYVKNVFISDAVMTLISEPGDKYKSNLARIFRIEKKDKEQKDGDLFTIKKVELKNFRFKRINLSPKQKKSDGFGIDFNSLDVTADIFARNLKYSDRTMTGTAEKVSLKEKSGYSAECISGSAKVGHGMTKITGLHLKDSWSDADIPELTLTYPERIKAFKNFKENVKIHAEVSKGAVAFNTLAFFVPVLKDKDIVADIVTAEVDGYVNDLSIKELRFTDRTSGIGGYIKANLKGLPNANALGIETALNDFVFTTEGLGTFLSNWMKGKSPDIGSVAQGSTFRFNGNASGKLSDLQVTGTADSGLGIVKADMSIKGIGGKGDMKLRGTVKTDDLDIGEFIGKDFVHECSLDSKLSAEFSNGSASVTIDSLNVRRLNLLDYDYNGILAAGTFSQQSFNGRVVSNDPNLNFIFQGLVNLGRHNDNARYRFYASLGYADLNALKIDQRGMSTVSVGSINADYTRIAKGDLTGSVDASGIILENESGRRNIGDIQVTSKSGIGNNEMRFKSSFAEGSFTGTKSLGVFFKDIMDLSARRELEALLGKPEDKWDGSTYRVDFNFHDTRDILSFIAPGAYIADSTSIRLRIQENGLMRGRIASQRIAFKEKYLKGLSIDFDNDDNALNCTVTGNELKLTPGIILMNNAIMLYANDNSVGIGYNYDNGAEVENRGEFYLTGDLSSSSPGSPVINARSLASNICLNGNDWILEPSECLYSKQGTSIKGFKLTNGVQTASIDGGLSKTVHDSLLVQLDNIDLSNFNSLIGKDINASGSVSGRVLVTSPLTGNFGVKANLISDETGIAGHRAGTIVAGCSLSEGDDNLVFAVRNSLDGHSTINTSGSFNVKYKILEMLASLDGFDFGYAAPFLTSVFSGLEGKISGTVGLDGPLNKLDISGDNLQLSDALMRIAFTNVQYKADGPMHIDNRGLYFDNISIHDRFEGKGNLSGGIRFDRFKDFSMDTRITLDNIEFLDTSLADNSSFYGHVFGTGRLNLNGPFDALTIDIDATTAKSGSFHIPINSATSSSTKDLLVFIEPQRYIYVDPYDLMMNTMAEAGKKRSNLEVKLKVNATPGVQANLEIDKSSGNVLTGRGSGTISLNVKPSSGSFNINGDYTLNSGNYHFSALGIANKDFSILDGSSIKFNGDIMDSDLNIDAQYSTKTSLSALISDTTSVSTRRNVECGISITDKLSNPQLAFSINVPDLDPATKSRVESALSTDDKVQKQFIALLVTNNFLPDDQSGIVNNSNILYSNFADIMANQVNNILQRLEIPLDLGLKYQESGSGASIFDVALSTQLFNNRVSVNGNIGNRQYRSSGNEDVVGDLDIEIKMDRDGEVRLNVFSHSADAYTNYLDDSQRNGIGIAYQKEFNSFWQFIKNIFSTKEARQAREIESVSIEEERVVINIDD